MLTGANPSHTGAMVNAGAIACGLLVGSTAIRLAGLPAFAQPSGFGQIPTLTISPCAASDPLGTQSPFCIASSGFGISTRPDTFALALAVRGA